MAPVEDESSAEIAAPIAVVFAVVADLELVPRWQPDVKVAECLERDADGRAVLIHTQMETVIRRTEATLRVSFDEPTCVSWVMEKGDVPTFEGSWTLTEIDRKTTRVDYAVTIDFGRKLGMLVRGPAGKAMAGAAVSSMPGKLKAYIEADHAGAKKRGQAKKRARPKKRSAA